MYRQPVEHVEGRVHTSDYRIHGTLFPRPSVGMPDQLNRQDQPFLPVASPRLFATSVGEVHDGDCLVRGDFIAVPRESILWVVGGEVGSPDIREFRWREVAVLFGAVLLRGRLRVGSGMRTSDYIRGRVVNKPFDALFDATVSTLRGGVSFEHLDIDEQFPFLTVNLRVNTGIVELGSVFDESAPLRAT